MEVFSLCAKSILGRVGDVGNIAELGQNLAHHREQVQWTRRGYRLDSQSLRLDALDHAKEEIRSHYDTYVTSIDTLLLVLALIWPFALNAIQFSDPFVPGLEAPCSDCIEEEHPWLVGVWIGLVGIILILPFWGILMLIRCKLKLDGWLEYSLAGLYRERRQIVSIATNQATAVKDGSLVQRQGDVDDTDQAMFRLVGVVLGYQDYLANIWNDECAGLVRASRMLLWMSAVAALMLTSFSIWIFLVNKGGTQALYSQYFILFIVGGCLLPTVFVSCQQCQSKIEPPALISLRRKSSFDRDLKATGSSSPSSTRPQI